MNKGERIYVLAKCGDSVYALFFIAIFVLHM